MFRFKCTTCNEWHEGMPTFGVHVPATYLSIPENERDARCALTEDTCVIDRKWFFGRGCLELPVHDVSEPFVWGVWVSLSEDSFAQCRRSLQKSRRSHIGPFFGWLSTALPVYPSTLSLKTMVHLRDNWLRPRIELEPTDHPLAIEQRDGIAINRVAEIYAHCVHQQA
jgi:hypothetical protein